VSAQADSAPSPGGLRARRIALRVPIVDADAVYGAALGIVLAWVAVRANGGLRVGNTTTVEIILDVLAGAVAVVALLTVPNLRHRAPGTAAVAAFGLLVLGSLISTVWSVDPAASWLDANRLVTYLAVFGIGMAFVRLAPHRWAALIGGVTFAAVIVSGYALLHKTFPAQLQPDEIYARLREPFGYWNAVGLMAAMGVPGCLWLGARRAGHAAMNALAYPALGLLFVVILLSYSRGSLLAVLVGCAFWFGVTPLRLRGFVVLAVSAVGAIAVIGWTFSQDALTKDHVPIALQDGAGHELFIAVIAMLLGLLIAGLAIGFVFARRAPSAHTRRIAAYAIAVCLALVPVVAAVDLARSERGLGGSISHAWTQLTDPSAQQPSNAPGRLTGVGSVRAQYWDEALKIFKDHPIAGVGAGGYGTARLRYRRDDLQVQHAHGYVVQVLADRGLIGLALSLGALIALAFAVAQATGLKRGAVRTTPERVGLLTLTTVLIVFGVHSFVDWTWFIPGLAIPALLIGGWLAGRGPLELPPRRPERMLARLRAGVHSQPRVIAATLAMALAIIAAWAAWQPQRSIDAGNEALAAAAERDYPKARELVQTAHDRNPLSTEPYFEQAAIEQAAGNNPGALRALEGAVRLQPGNPQTWTQLATFQLDVLHNAAEAKKTLSAALYLDPRSLESITLLIQANRELATK